ncbi:restriction endonuclease subunit S [Halobellus ordinarius]|uniref:restriction endonuclease subunit S n=1 Tax=Halobellus ordinarius TaxID=3075120 RepID=UPI00287FFB8D|nr:restriction endonuclease subunit S [Halobellus sp. ZY16]
MSEDATLDEFVNAEGDDSRESATDTETLDQEQFGPFTLSTPGEWSAKRLGDIKRLITRGKQPTYDDDGIPVINQECIYWDGWHFENLRYLDEDVGEDWKDKYFPQRGDVILNSTGQGTLGRAQVYPDNKRRAIDSHVTLLRTDDELNPYFHRYFLESHLGQALLYSMCVNGSTGQIELSKTRLDLQPVPLPPLPEQRKIATVLYTVDRAIEKTEEVITQTERLREGAMQDLFSRGVRGYDDFQETKYGTIPASWEVKPVREIADRIGSGGTPNTGKEEYYGGDIEWVKTDDLNSGLVDSAKTTITAKGLDESAAKLFPEGTVVFAMYGGALGQNGRLGMEAAMNQACCGIVTDKSEMDSYLLHQQLIHRKKQLTALSAGTHQQNISQSMIEKFEVFVPPLDEQKEMVNILKSIERTIETNTNEKERLKRLKRGLMQDLLSGTVRTTDTNIEVPEEIAQYG